MIVQCKDCRTWFEDVYRNTWCPHDAFAANDGNNRFRRHTDSYLSDEAPPENCIFEAHRNG